MTTPTVAEVAKPRGVRGRSRGSAAGVLLEELRDELAAARGIAWPCDRYRAEPCAFATDILGVVPWEKQREILNAARDYDRVSVRSGHKVGKSHTAAILAFWFFCSFVDARVIFSSVTARQVDEILWREVRKMRTRAGRCVDCKIADAKRAPEDRARRPAPMPCPHSSQIDGTMHDLARSGFRSEDMREIVGFTAREAEAVAGISGENILYIVDEASGVDDAIFEAMEGNRAGGARLVMFSNPTRTEGEFYRSHKSKALKVDANGKRAGFYKTIHISSEETPNVRLGRKVVPGLAMADWIAEKREEWGEDSALYKVRVRGEFVENEDGKILSVHDLTLAEARWAETPAVGRLHIGLDPAGPGQAGDETAFAIRRGFKILDVITFRGLTEDAHVTHLLGLLKVHRKPREPKPLVTIDREGPIGAALYGRLRAVADAQRSEATKFDVLGIRSSERAEREPHLYDRVRDELWAGMAQWIRAGGAIPENAVLTKELHAPSWFQPLGSSKLKATPKTELRKMLDGRSPDRADAVTLSVWETSLERAAAASANASDEDDDEDLDDGAYALAGADPYAVEGSF